MALLSFRRLARLFVVLAVALGVWAPVQAAEQQLRIGYQKGGGLLAVLKAQGTLEKALGAQGYQVTWREFQAGPQLLEALNAGSVDVGYTGSPPPIFAQAAGVDLVYLGAEPASESVEAIVVPNGSAIRAVSELKGKKVAVQKGSSANFLLVAALNKAGLTLKDIQPVYLAPADARAAFANGSVDAWAIWDPYLAAIQQGQSVRVLADYKGLLRANAFYEGSRRFADAHPQAIHLLLAELAKAGAWANTHKPEVSRILAEQIGLPEPVIATWQARTRYGVTPLTPEIIATQQKVADVFHDQGLIPRKVDVSQAVWHAPH
ncbi:aliphatic sulfonate ABC transporter substrate-binding protein [Pseudomonas oryzihabitans]|uniref:aliphatic sulfonate ABC transporter substrate-binding protein n=1 Tax=Pseudomonas oryzihabitans TaxID=47885 RepID=UPI00111D8B18|nr:aliphatic sulfonate ABC transporter substrate-binding protein [Pseudomonas psychrotolerans]QDD90280.1 aliphatic sulfonate ABC transporter substrate-binding protein [Pseudomonas psychrotolerans]